MPVHGLPFSDSQLFDSLNVVLPAWLLLIGAPRWRVTHAVVALVAAYVSALYLAVLVTMFIEGPGPDYGEMLTYQGVQKLLATPAATLPAWSHYVAFDLWVARWAVLDAAERGMPHLLVVPCLPTIMFFGPTGLLLYMLLRVPFKPKQPKTKIR